MQDHKNTLRPGPRFKEDTTYAVKAALFDIDNTLVGNESPDVPTQRFREAVESSKGTISIGLATARPLSKVEHILDYLQADGLSILCNGAQILDNKERIIVAEWCIDTATCAEIVEFAKDKGITFWINDDGVDYFPGKIDKNVFEKQTNIWDQSSERIAVPEYRFSKPFVIVLHGLTAQQVDDVAQFVSTFADKRITSLVAHETAQSDGSHMYDVFVVHERANKKDALHEVARIQNIAINQIMAVGDGRNDAVLVGEAGVGVAMGNSAKETLAAATFIAPDWHDDGAATALEYATHVLTVR